MGLQCQGTGRQNVSGYHAVAPPRLSSGPTDTHAATVLIVAAAQVILPHGVPRARRHCRRGDGAHGQAGASDKLMAPEDVNAV